MERLTSASGSQGFSVRPGGLTGGLRLWGPAHTGLLLCLALAGLVLNLAATRFGPGMTSDTMTYLAAADTWLMGLGLGRLSGPDGFKPLTHFPPLFPLLIAGGRSLGATWSEAARWINAVFHGGIVLLGGLMVGQLSSSVWASLFGAGVLLLSPVLLDVNSQAMSEPGYLFLGFLGLWLLSRWRAEGGRWTLIAAAVSIGLAWLTRYVGASLVLTSLASIVLARSKTLRTKATEVAVFLMVSLPPIMAWMVRNAMLSGGATNRRLIWHPPPRSYWGSAIRLLWEWTSPLALSGRRELYAGLALAGTVLGVVLWALWRVRRRDPETFHIAISRPAGHLLVLYVAIYAGTLMVSRLLLDATVPMDNRTASPIYVSLAILLASVLPMIWLAMSDWPAARAALVLLLTLLLVWSGARVGHEVTEQAAQQRGFLASLWRRGPLREVWDLPQETVIYTDNLERLYYFYGRGGYQVQHAIDVVTGLARQAYESELGNVRQALASGEAVLLLLVPESDAASVFPEITAGLDPIISTNYGTLYMGPYNLGS